MKTDEQERGRQRKMAGGGHQNGKWEGVGEYREWALMEMTGSQVLFLLALLQRYPTLK